MSNREKIQEIALARKIQFLVHFTRVENIESIMKYGLLPVRTARELGITPKINDQLRLDGRLDGTSLSISFPNGQMFYRLRQDNPEIDWVVLAISTSVLWSKPVLFCKHNAADARISRMDDNILASANTFEEMFQEMEGLESRADQGIKVSDPTDVQAEVLVKDKIEPEFIIGALFNDEAVRAANASFFGKRRTIVHVGRKGVFANRTYYRKFGGG